MENARKLLSTDPYKGVRDFYPEDLYVRKHIFDVMRAVAERYGYVEYDASLLEPTELYRAKTGDEIVNEQTYSFTDRGGRDVTLRPEMTPTVARMVAARRRELAFPLRWYSIPNVFRYERPQRGRLREHWQLNVDMFGEADVSADAEIIAVAYDIMRAFGAEDTDFSIKVNSRKILTLLLEDYFALSPQETQALSKLIDRRAKMDAGDFEREAQAILGDNTSNFFALLNVRDLEDCCTFLPDRFNDSEAVSELRSLFDVLRTLGIANVVFDISLVRGFDYYTGTVFEVFDTNPKNSRSLFGGGRYDGLTEIFGVEPVAAVGFGMGDVTIRDFLETRGLLPAYRGTAHLYLCTTEKSYLPEAERLAKTLRTKGVNVAVDLSGKRVGDQIRTADKKAIPYVICIGPEEAKTKQYKIKNLATSDEVTVGENRIQEVVKMPRG